MEPSVWPPDSVIENPPGLDCVYQVHVAVPDYLVADIEAEISFHVDNYPITTSICFPPNHVVGYDAADASACVSTRGYVRET